MNNALRLGAAVTAATLMGVTDNSEADPGSYGRMIQKAREERGEYENPLAAWPPPPPSFVQNSVRAGVDSVLQPPFPGIDGNAAVDPNQLNLARELVRLTSEKQDLRDELAVTRAQVADLVKRLEITETTCEDATKEDGCPAGCVYDGYAPVKNECPAGYECATSVMHIVEKQEPEKPQPYQWHD